MNEPRPTKTPSVVHVRLFGIGAKEAAKKLGIGAAQPISEELQARMKRELEEERVARKEAGLSPFLPDRDLFKDEFPKGIISATIEYALEQMRQADYFLIATSYRRQAVDEVKRDEVRLVFSRLESDKTQQISAPSWDAIEAFFDDSVAEYMYIHDRRRIHAGTGEEIGNNAVDLCGQWMRRSKREYWRLPLLRMRPHILGQFIDGIWCLDERRDKTPQVEEQTEAPEAHLLTAAVAELIKRDQRSRG